MPLTHKQQFNKRHGFDKDESHSKAELSKLSKLPIRVLNIVYDRGVGAYKTNPESVRPQVKSKEQWAMARVYAFINKIELAQSGKGVKLDHDTDLIKK
jgi:hypothetical protein